MFIVVQGIINKVSGISNTLSQSFHWYHSFVKQNDQNSGAYIFRPNSSDAYPVNNVSGSVFVHNSKSIVL